ncbi:hypothetical protein BJP34_24670 [Moorena producens PAL-8-15-08-1]|uniref:Uncharacterized protein n=1 Tax=Moorena producens PAL-8-15-08-1 TaxID=1458985 RepID=A0A1D8TXM3_9CYAN|nr:hypothetical protein BJP34_24670 [Moorena producens PAL-8-15-08-1]
MRSGLSTFNARFNFCIAILLLVRYKFLVFRDFGAGSREEGRGKREEGRGKREEGRGKREEGRGQNKCVPHEY